MNLDWMTVELFAIVALVVGHFVAIVNNRSKRSD